MPEHLSPPPPGSKGAALRAVRGFPQLFPNSSAHSPRSHFPLNSPAYAPPGPFSSQLLDIVVVGVGIFPLQ